MEEENQEECVLGEFGEEYNNLKISILDSYQMYCKITESCYNKPDNFETWIKKESEEIYFGQYFLTDNVIYINKSITNKEKFKSILIHELTHAFIDYKLPSNIDYDEEVVCDLLGKHYDEYNKLITTVCDVCVKRFEKEREIL